MESRQFRRADGVLGVGFVQAHTGREVAAIAWPDVEPRRIGLEDLAGHGIELVPVFNPEVAETTEVVSAGDLLNVGGQVAEAIPASEAELPAPVAEPFKIPTTNQRFVPRQ